MPTTIFENPVPVTIDAGAPSTVTSSLVVSGFDGARVGDVEVVVDLDHTWDGDLTVSVLNPDGTRVVLVDRRGGRGDHFRQTRFDADAAVSILNAAPPFQGSFRPEGDLGNLRNGPAEGTWRLEVRDRAFQDGGTLRRWGLTITTAPPPPLRSRSTSGSEEGSRPRSGRRSRSPRSDGHRSSSATSRTCRWATRWSTMW